MHLNEGFSNIPADDGSNNCCSDDDVHANIASHGTAVADCELCTCFVVQHKMRGSSVPTFLFQRNQRTED